MKVLITGASGLLGSNLMRDLAADFELHGWANLNAKPPVRSIDLLNSPRVQSELIQLKPDAIVHCAALTKVDTCEANPTLASKINVEATATLAKYCETQKCKLIFISTDAVYNGNARGPHFENETLVPSNHYARTKCEAEQVVRESVKNHVIARVNIFGWNSTSQISSAEWMLKSLTNKEPLNLFYDVCFSPILVNHLAKYLKEFLQSELNGTFNVGSPDSVSKWSFGQMLAETFGISTSGIQKGSVDSHAFKATRSKNMIMDSSKVAKATGRPLVSVKDGLLDFRKLYENGEVARLKGIRNFNTKEWTE
jgi:dTDP-4-dehydrorhamnose reductase